MRFLLALSLILIFSGRILAQNNNISGYVIDANSQEALIGATLYDAASGTGTATNEYGYYSLTLTSSDAIKLRVSYVGYITQYVTLSIDQNQKQNIALEPEGYLEEVVVTAEEESNIEEVQMSRMSVPIATIKAMPALFGEVDILKSLQLLPGIQGGTEGSSGLYVRGGGPDQNLILLDGVPVYNASHLFGFFSVFNSDAVKHVDVYKGGFPARYGGRLSSVLDIRMKEGDMREWHGEGGIGIISSRFTVEGPLKTDKASIMLSGRRTYIDILARPIIKQQFRNEGGEGSAGYYFYDFNAKFNYKFSDRDRIYLSTYFGNDKFYTKFEDNEGDYTSEDNAGIKWGNVTTSLRWNHLFNTRLFANSTLTYSQYRFVLFNESSWRGTDDNNQPTARYYKADYISYIKDFAYKFDLDYSLNSSHQVRTGLLATRHDFRPGAFQLNSDSQNELEFGQPSIKSWEFQAYAEDDWKISNRLKVNWGLHSSAFASEGSFYSSLQPRVNARFIVNQGLSLKASAVTMRQYIHLLTNSGIGLPTDLWVPSTDRVAPQSSWQVALGASKNLSSIYDISVEGYYKKMNNLIEYKEAASYFDFETNWQDQITRGNGQSYGSEVFLERKNANLSGWLGYTLSWANRTFSELNLGKTYPYKYDRRHDISLVLNYKLSERANFGGSWVYSTGNAVTLPLAGYSYQGDRSLGNSYYSGDKLLYYSNRNEYRMRSYHRMDISYSRVKKVRWGERKWVFGVYNLYAQRNPFYIDIEYDYEEQKNKFIQYSIFRFVPSVSYNFKF